MPQPNTENSLSGLIRKRIGPRQAHLVRLISEGRQLHKRKPDDSDETRGNLADSIEDVTAKLETVVEKLEQDNQEWIQVMASLSDDARPNEEAIYSYWATDNDEDKNFVFLLDDANSLMKMLKMKIDRLRPRTTSKETAMDPDASDTSARAGRTRRPPKLRHLELPVFNGDPLTFKEFWTLFSAAVDQEEYDNVTKFSYLRQQLRGAARDAVAGLEINEDNYPLAVQLLRERFEKTTPEIIGTLYSKLKMMPRCSDHHQSLRRTYDGVEIIVRQLKNVGVEMDSNQLLVMDILAKFPETAIREITMRKNVDIRSTVEETEKAIEEYIEQTELLSGMVNDLKPFNDNFHRSKDVPDNRNTWNKRFQQNVRDKYKNDESNTYPRSTNTSAFTTTDNPAVPKRECVFCGGAHFHATCTKYRTRTARQSRIVQVGNCERCLCHGHSKDECRTRQFKIRCFFCKATGEHSSPFCPTMRYGERKLNEDVVCHASNSSINHSAKNLAKVANPATKKTINALSCEETSVLSTALATISNPNTGQKRTVRVIFDNCSHRSYIIQEIVNELKLPEQKTCPLKVSVFGSVKSVTLDTKQVDVCMHLRDGSTIDITVNSTPLITSCSVTPTDLPKETRKLLETMKSALADDFDTEKGAPDFLIGADLFWDFVNGSRLKTTDGIYLIPTTLGMVLGGCYNAKTTSDDEAPVMLCLTERNALPGRETALSSVSWESRAKISPDVQDFWSLETIGITDDPVAKDDDIVMDQFKSSIEYVDGRYQVEWPWRENCHELPTNYNLALGRLKSLLKRFKKNGSTLPHEYSTIFDDQIGKGIIEKVLKEKVITNNITHYLAHHAVIKDDHATTKVRIVFDGSAKCVKNKPSLNECLMRGPVILPDLCAILLRFRLQQIAIISDVEKAFHQIALKESQRDAVRFLWLKDTSKLETEGNIQIYRFQRVPFGTISSPFLLAATILHHLDNSDSAIAKRIAANMYVDNCILGVDNLVEAIDFYRDAKTVFRGAGMNLREFASNSRELLQKIAKEDRCDYEAVKVLGMKWDVNKDDLHLQHSWNKLKSQTTKRDVLKAAASIFDPLGYFQPVTIPIKCFIRDLWTIKCEWDDQMPNEFLARWKELRAMVLPAFNIPIRRFVGPISENSLIVTFTDASEAAYAAVVYLRTPSKNGWKTEILFAKSRLTPKVKWKKSVTIPRLELLGLTIGTRISQFVRDSLMTALKVPVHLFCDNTCVLNWIRSDKQKDRFTTNRVKEIRNIENATFRYIKSAENPADLATRGISASELQNCNLWWHGPEFLQMDCDKWPQKDDLAPVTSKEIRGIQEKAPQYIACPGVLFTGEGSEDNSKWSPCNIDATRHSNLQKLLRVTVVVLKFLKRKLWNPLSEERKRPYARINLLFNQISNENPVRARELCEARSLWIKSIQDEHFSEVHLAIQKKRFHPLVRHLNLETDDRGLLRCRGRLSKADLPDEAIQPLLIPKKCYVTRLIIDYAHLKTMHAGVRQTLCDVRRRFWIPQGRQAVQNVIRQCVVCKKYRGNPFALPKMPPLPRERVARAKPFEFTGLDLIGPINVKVNEVTKKSWVCIFTCLTVRAIHLEWMMDCTVVSFINALSRLIARRGTPAKILSDNAAQFHVTNDFFKRTWKRLFAHDQLLSYVAERNMDWSFTTELAPWQGGIYERLVGIVKNTMKAQIGRKLFEFDNFVTLLTEVEAVVNSRPITFVYSDYGSGCALRPMDFLVESSNGSPGIDPTTKPEGGEAAKYLVKHWKDKQRKLDQFWKLWYHEYLLSLRQRDDREHRNRRNAAKSSPRIGEIVIVQNTDAPRGTWKLARVIKVMKGSDGSVRAAELVMPNRQKIRRPINQLYSMEIQGAYESEKNDETPDQHKTGDAESELGDFEGFEEYEAAEAANLRTRYDETANHSEVASLCSEARDLLLNGLKIDAVHSIEREEPF